MYCLCLRLPNLGVYCLVWRGVQRPLACSFSYAKALSCVCRVALLATRRISIYTAKRTCCSVPQEKFSVEKSACDGSQVPPHHTVYTVRGSGSGRSWVGKVCGRYQRVVARCFCILEPGKLPARQDIICLFCLALRL